MSRIAIVSVLLLSCVSAQAAIVEYDLTIELQMVNIAELPANGMTINGSIPGPTLRFNEGDTAHIKVHNKMNVDTSIHWHGILVPPNMNGAEGPNPSHAPTPCHNKPASKDAGKSMIPNTAL